jgi:hypothetical protein
MPDEFKLVFRTHMTPWTQDCVYYVVLTITQAGIGVARDPTKGGLGLEEEWFAPWGDILSLTRGHMPEPIVRLEFLVAGSQTAIRDIRVPPVREPPFGECAGPHLVEAILLGYQERNQPPTIDQVRRWLAEIPQD